MYPVSCLKSFPNLAGIYKFVNKINGKIYIGEGKSLKRRVVRYFHEKKEPRPIIRAFNKYGFDNFEYYVVESFPLGTPKSVLLDREEFWIKFYQTLNPKIGYNVCPRGTDATGRICNEVTKSKLRQKHLGKKHSDATKKAMSDSHKGEKHWQYGKSGEETSFWGKKLSPEHKKALMDSQVGIPKYYNRRKIHQINPKTKEILSTWDSLGEAAVGIYGDKATQQFISRVLCRRRNKYKGSGWIYAETPKVTTKREAENKFNSQL